MRVLLSTIGSRGDVQPLVGLASELKALGQEVHLCVPPDFREWIERLGMSVTPIGPELRTMTASRPPTAARAMSPEQRRQLAEASVAAQFETVTAAAHGCDVIVAATALQIAARSVAERMGIPYVFVAYSPNVLPSPHHAPPPLPPLPGQAPTSDSAGNRELWAQDTARFNALFGASLNAHRASIGLPPIDDVRSHVFTGHPWLAADPTLAPWPDPENESVFQPGAWILPDDRPLSREMEDFLSSGEPPIYFGFGSIRAPEGLSQVMIQSARAVGRRAIVSRGWAELALMDSAPDCITVGEVNQQALFTRVAAVVHHGGAGTTTAAALAGAPQVIIPQLYDQHYWSQRVDALGIGVAHAAGTPTMHSLRDALARAVEPDVAARARSVANGVRRDGAGVAVQRLLVSARTPWINSARDDE
jgi:vancomycin aglycone glucosyltransferase